MKKIMSGLFKIMAVAVIVMLAAAAYDLWKVNEGKGTVTHGVARPTDGTFNIGVRTVTTGPLGIVEGYYDEYLGGSWAKGLTFFGKVTYDPYVETWRLL